MPENSKYQNFKSHTAKWVKKKYPKLNDQELEAKVVDVLNNYATQNKERDSIEDKEKLEHFNQALDSENFNTYLDNID
jgi:hypothetical protein